MNDKRGLMMSVIEFDPQCCNMYEEDIVTKVQSNVEGIVRHIKEVVANTINTLVGNIIEPAVQVTDPRAVFNAEYCITYDESPVKLTEEQLKKKQSKLQELRNFEPPTVEEAVLDYQNGEKHAFDYVFHIFKSKIEYMARVKSNGNQLIYEELLSDLQMKFFECVQKYKGGKVKFNTFFWNCAQNVVGMYFTRKSAKKRCSEFGEVSIFANSPIDEEVKVLDTIQDHSKDNVFENLCLSHSITDRVFPLLEQKDQNILSMIAEGFEVKDIAKKINMTRAGVYLRWKKIKEKVRNSLSPDEISDILQTV